MNEAHHKVTNCVLRILLPKYHRQELCMCCNEFFEHELNSCLQRLGKTNLPHALISHNTCGENFHGLFNCQGKTIAHLFDVEVLVVFVVRLLTNGAWPYHTLFDKLSWYKFIKFVGCMNGYVIGKLKIHARKVREYKSVMEEFCNPHFC